MEWLGVEEQSFIEELPSGNRSNKFKKQFEVIKLEKVIKISLIIVCLFFIGCSNQSNYKRNNKANLIDNKEEQVIKEDDSSTKSKKIVKEKKKRNLNYIPDNNLEQVQVLRIVDQNDIDFKQISKLPNLIKLNLGNNDIKTLSFLTNLEKIKWLWLRDNQIDDINYLSRLRHLVWLDISGNNIKDISPLTNLNHLEVLYLNDNQIKNLRPLLSLPKLKKLRVWNNDLNSEDFAVINKLQSWGVEVEYKNED